MKTVKGRVIIDTNVLIYATLEEDGRFERSRELLLAPIDGERCISVQNLAEMHPNLAGPARGARRHPRQPARTSRVPGSAGMPPDGASATPSAAGMTSGCSRTHRTGGRGREGALTGLRLGRIACPAGAGTGAGLEQPVRHGPELVRDRKLDLVSGEVHDPRHGLTP